jgi:hypothetical protein
MGKSWLFRKTKHDGGISFAALVPHYPWEVTEIVDLTCND